MRVDVHQHVWTEPLLDALAKRRSPPLIARAHGEWVLHAGGERPYRIDTAGETAARRRRLLRGDRLDAAIVAISSPIGIEALPREEATELIEAHLAGVRALGNGFAAWGPLALDGAESGDVDRILDHGCAGISVPAGALLGPDALERLGSVLERVATRGVPLFIHPGPGLGSPAAEAEPREPPWWRAVTDYVSQMQAAWLTFATVGRPRYPELVVVFSMLAGGAPLLSERLDTRGGPAIDLRDPRSFYDGSSYGPYAVAAMGARVGLEMLVYGSDRPVLAPLATEHDERLQANAERFLTPPSLG